MSLTASALASLNSHWAVSAIGQTTLDQARRLADERLARQAVGNQISFRFEHEEYDDTLDESEDELLTRVAFAYELAALEGLDALVHSGSSTKGLSEQAMAASHEAFDLRRLLAVPTEPTRRILAVLRLSALAYCGDRWPDLRSWFGLRQEALEIPSAASAPWDTKVLYRLVHCWVRLFRKKGWGDLDRVRETIVGLRDDQKTYEKQQFEAGSEAENRVVALRLIALYHWAKATEVLARYLLKGDSPDPSVELDKHFEAGIRAATSVADAELEILLRYLYASARIMARSSLWSVLRRVNSMTADFVRALARREHQSMFELLPPQRAALLEQGLSDPTKTAIVVDMPTSGSKTSLTEFYVLQALNQFRDTSGWVAYVAPTRALCRQITHRLRRAFGPIGIHVEQLPSAVEVDFEYDLRAAETAASNVLVGTPEELSRAIRNKRIKRTLALLVVDWAHNWEVEGRGSGIEFFLTTVKRDCPEAHFLLLMPDAALEYASAWVMARSSLWSVLLRVNSKTSDFVRSLARREHQPMFELLPPQRAALLEQGLLDPTKTAIVVDMPTSGGKTLLAEFRILQALNQFRDAGGWVAYVAPTRALCSQITRRLRRDFRPIGIRVEQLSSAVEVDVFEDNLLAAETDAFDVLVATPEKLSLAIRNERIERTLALLVVDEAHNLEAEGRGLRIEFFLATVKRDCPEAHFLLLMPFVESTDDIARWLAEEPNAATAISLASSAWKPNERIVGLYRTVADESVRAGWHLEFETLTTTPKALRLAGTHRVGGVRPLPVPRGEVLSKGVQVGLGVQTAAMASILCRRGTSIAVANNIPSVWKMARLLQDSLPKTGKEDPDVLLVQDFLRTEIAEDFELVSMLDHGVGVHHTGLSDEARSLMEWLAESGKLKVLCATTTIAQGINFPVSSVFLASKSLPGQHRSVSMTPREFWNLAGRAGRVGHDSVGVVGLAEGTNRKETISFVQEATGALVSRLVTLLDDLAERGELAGLSEALWKEEWEDFRCYVAHLCAQAANLDALLADAEHLLRNTYGYTTLRADPQRREQADALLESTRAYASKCMDNPGLMQLADSTGFSPEGVSKAVASLNRLEAKLVPDDWEPASLFGRNGRMADLFGVMLHVPQLKRQFAERSGERAKPAELPDVARDWVNGEKLKEIATRYFRKSGDASDTPAITETCRTIYRAIANGGAWGISALGAVAGADRQLGEEERRRLDVLPAMIYHGVSSEEGVLMRMNSVPRSVASQVGAMYREAGGTEEKRYSVGHAREFLQGMDAAAWDRARPSDAALSAADYQRVWRVLAGEER